MTTDKDALLRGAFERWITAPPFEKSISRYGETGTYWPGCYVDYQVHLAWDAWKESARITAAKEPQGDGCRWTEDEYEGGAWDTDCGQRFCIEDGTPEQNDMKFCCYCGHKILPLLPRSE